jgi:type VI protein secretion system component Hcp
MKSDRVANLATKELSEADLEVVTGGSKSSESGAGKVTFNLFSVTRNVDKASPTLF